VHGRGNGNGEDSRRNFSGRSKSFRPRRRPNKHYRPFTPKKYNEKKLPHENMKVTFGEVADAKDELTKSFGHQTAEMVKRMREDQYYRETSGGVRDATEEELRIADYMTAEHGSTEELIYERKATEHMTDEEKAKFNRELDAAVAKAEKMSVDDDLEDGNQIRKLKPSKPKKGEAFDHLFMNDEQYADFHNGEERSPEETNFEPNRLAHGEWTDMIVDVRRGIHLWRGGRLETYRAMVIGGNLNGCGGFGVGRHPEPLKAVQLAARKCRRNIFFVERYQGNGLTSDLVGVQNSTKCVIRAVDNGLRGNPLMKEILLRFGISNAQCKAYGPRHLFNVVRATFKALCTHESIEEVALKRGKRIVSIDKALRVQV